jgi:hypothetical protein
MGTCKKASDSHQTFQHIQLTFMTEPLVQRPLELPEEGPVVIRTLARIVVGGF